MLLALVLHTACGVGALAVLGVGRTPAELLARGAIAPLAGMAWTGIAAATLATVGVRLGVVGLFLLTALTCGAGAWRLRRSRSSSSSSPDDRSSDRVEKLLAGLSVTAIAVAGGFASAAFHDKPLADYDGWAIWGTKAKALAFLSSADADVLAGDAYARLHLEYPLLLPALHALPLELADGYESNTVILDCLALAAAGLVAVWGVYRGRVRPALLLAFLAAVVATPLLLQQLGTGYADVPLAVFAAAGLAAAGRWLVDGSGTWLALGTLFLASAALTKNEGLLFAASAYVPLFVAADGRRRLVALSAGLVAIAYAPWRGYLIAHGLGASDYDLSDSFDLGYVVGRLDRAPVAARELLEHVRGAGEFGFVAALVLGAIVLALVVGDRRLGVLTGGFVLLSLAGLVWVYVLTPYDLAFYLSTNGDRVVMAPVVGAGVLAPLLVEETARVLAARRR